MTNVTKLLLQSSLLLVSTSLMHCRHEEDSQAGARSRLRAGASLATAAASAEAPDVPATDTLPALSAAKPAELSEWAQSPMYKFRVTSVRRCEQNRSAATAPSVAARTSSKLRLGISVEVVANIDDLFVASRDATIEHEGVIVASVIELEPAGPCTPAFSPQMLKKGQRASGFVAFDVPDEAFARAAMVAFKPTRWAGATHTAVKLPECLDACPEGTSNADQRAAKRH